MRRRPRMIPPCNSSGPPRNSSTATTARGAQLALGDGARRFAIAHPGIAECLFQRAEPAFKVTPLRQTFAEDRPPHLFRTRRAHGANRFVKIDAGSLEVKFAV